MDFSKVYPLQTLGPLFPAPSVAFQEPGGCALLGRAAEPASQRVEQTSPQSSVCLSTPFSSHLHADRSHLTTSTLRHLLMVSSSSESQKLVVSSSLLITVLELSYPARWRSSRLWPFIRGPGTTERKPKTFSVTFHVCSSPCFLLQTPNIPPFSAFFDCITIFMLFACGLRAKSRALAP